jgi:phospholipase C
VNADVARENLEKVNHIVVLMLENRSFDHMLGFLSLPPEEGGAGRTDVDGLSGPARNFNEYEGKSYPIEQFGKGRLVKSQDPDHSGAGVEKQIAGGMGGFVSNYAETRNPKATAPKPGDPMRYQARANVPMFDFLAQEFAICDRWFCSVPGSTWPNRLTSLTGEARSKDNHEPPLYSRRSFVRSLPRDLDWRWYSSDPGSLRLVDDRYRVGWEDNFGYVEKPTAVQPHTFYADAIGGRLPSLAWIDPNFVDLGGLVGADDDHPPTDVMAAQSFVLKIYNVLSKSPTWAETLFVVVYDEHGGFYDHLDPTRGLPEEFAERAEFESFGPRVPALVISPLVERGAVFGSQQGDDPSFFFDHCALIKTILLRFAADDCSGLPPRVASASHLGHLLTAPVARKPPVVPPKTIEEVSAWWGAQIARRLVNPAASIPALEELRDGEGEGAEGALEWLWDLVNRLLGWLPFLHSRRKPKVVVAADANELERGVARAALEIRRKGLPPGQP